MKVFHNVAIKQGFGFLRCDSVSYCVKQIFLVLEELLVLRMSKAHQIYQLMQGVAWVATMAKTHPCDSKSNMVCVHNVW